MASHAEVCGWVPLMKRLRLKIEFLRSMSSNKTLKLAKEDRSHVSIKRRLVNLGLVSA